MIWIKKFKKKVQTKYILISLTNLHIHTSTSSQRRRCPPLNHIVHVRASQSEGGVSGREGDEVEGRHPPHRRVGVRQRREQIRRRRLRLIPDLRDLPQESLPLLAGLRPQTGTTDRPEHTTDRNQTGTQTPVSVTFTSEIQKGKTAPKNDVGPDITRGATDAPEFPLILILII